MTNFNQLSELALKFAAAKEKETKAKEERMAVEAKLERALAVPGTWEGSRTRAVGPWVLTVRRKNTVKVDAARVRELAQEKNCTELLPRLFTWKAEVNKKNWDAADPAVCALFNEALTVTAGRVSFAIREREEKED